MAMEIGTKEYKLSCELRGHKDEVRGICVCGDLGIATCSRDRTVRLWLADGSENRKYSASKIMQGHTLSIGPVVYLPPCDELPEGGLLSGGMDTDIILWDLRTGERAGTLSGHGLEVTGIALDGDDIVSSSLDCTLRRWRWKDDQDPESWEAHDSEIRALIKLPSGELLTGSNDKMLKLWKGNKCVRTFKGHSGTVRALAYMPGLDMHEARILSASDDGSIRLWALDGETLREMNGHTSVVYSVDAHLSGLIVSSSEDCTAKIWKDGACIQSIQHPGCVWDTKFLENGDIVTACSDGIVRIWTSEQCRITDRTHLISYARQLYQYKQSRLEPHEDESRLWLMVRLPNCHRKVEKYSYKQIADILDLTEEQRVMIIPRRTPHFLYMWEDTSILIVPEVISLQNKYMMCISFNRPATVGEILENKDVEHILERYQSAKDPFTGRSIIAVETFLKVTLENLKQEVDSLRSDSVFKRKPLNDIRGKIELVSLSTISLLNTIKDTCEKSSRLHILSVQIKEMKTYLDRELLRVNTKIKKLDELVSRNNIILSILGFFSTALIWVLASLLQRKKTPDAAIITVSILVGISLILLIWRSCYNFMH